MKKRNGIKQIISQNKYRHFKIKKEKVLKQNDYGKCFFRKILKGNKC